MCWVLGEMQKRQKRLRSCESPGTVGKGVGNRQEVCMCSEETCTKTGSGNYGLWFWPCWVTPNKSCSTLMPSAKWGFGPDECKACSTGRMLSLPWARIYDCANSQNGTHSTIPSCPSHWLYLHYAFLIDSGGVISVFPAETVSALLANFSFSSFSLSLLLSASFLFTSWPLFDLHHGGRNGNGCGERTWVRASGRVNGGTPHSADIQEWTTHKTPGSQSSSIPPHPANTPFPISVRIRMDAEQGNTGLSSWNRGVYNNSPFEGSPIIQTLCWKDNEKIMGDFSFSTSMWTILFSKEKWLSF